MKEDEVTEVKNEQIISETLAIMAREIRIQNNIILCLLRKFNIDADLNFSHLTKEQFEKEMNEKIVACEKAIRKIYGRSETDKS